MAILSPAQPSGPATPAEPATPTRAPRASAVPLALPVATKRTHARQAAAALNHRDSLKRRDALLRGKEGTRRRQRWENDRLLSNPHAVPPSAADWEPRPLHPTRVVPYECASLYDTPAFQKRQARNAPKPQDPVDRVPKDLKARLKRSHGAIGLLQSLEDELRLFVIGQQQQQQQHDPPKHEEPTDMVHVDIEDVDDESDEEIVFVSKKMRYQIQRQESIQAFIEELATEKVLFESALEDPGAAFGRWLVHSIAGYYGLRSWSVTTGNPAKRLAYVGLRGDLKATAMPKPLYLML